MLTFFNRPTFDKKPRTLVISYLAVFAVCFTAFMTFMVYRTYFANLYDEETLLLVEKLTHWTSYLIIPLSVFAAVGLATPNSAKKSLRNGAIATTVILAIQFLLLNVIFTLQ